MLYIVDKRLLTLTGTTISSEGAPVAHIFTVTEVRFWHIVSKSMASHFYAFNACLTCTDRVSFNYKLS